MDPAPVSQLPFPLRVARLDVNAPSLTTSYTTGYDGSMMNGLQSLDQWNDYFGHPTGSALGLLNAIQACAPVLPCLM